MNGLLLVLVMPLLAISNDVSVSFETSIIRAFRLMTSKIMLDVLSRSPHEHCFQ